MWIGLFLETWQIAKPRFQPKLVPRGWDSDCNPQSLDIIEDRVRHRRFPVVIFA
jgi:hypothetical protein